MSQIAILLDEDVWVGLAPELRKRDFDVIAVSEIDRKGISDIAQLRYATAQGRAILTHNIRDFAPLAQQFILENEHHAGIIVAYQLSKGELLRRVVTLIEMETAENLANSLRFLQ